MRFAARNTEASLGGKARAAKLSPERRSEIARLGWLAMIERRGGDAREIMRNVARAANPADSIFYGHTK